MQTAPCIGCWLGRAELSAALKSLLKQTAGLVFNLRPGLSLAGQKSALRPHKPIGRRGGRAKDEILATPRPRCLCLLGALHQPGSADGAGSAWQGAGSSNTFGCHRIPLQKRCCRERERPDRGRLLDACAAQPVLSTSARGHRQCTGKAGEHEAGTRRGWGASAGHPARGNAFTTPIRRHCVCRGQGQREGAASLCGQRCQGEGAAGCPARGRALPPARASSCRTEQSPSSWSHTSPLYTSSLQPPRPWLQKRRAR